MATYASQNDLELQLPGITLAQLTDDVGGQTIDATVIDRMIVDAESAVNSFCRGKHDIPFTSPIPDNVRRWTVSLAILNLYKRRPDLLLPPATKEDVELTKTELRGVRDNKILIDDENSVANTASYYQIRKTAPQQIFKSNEEKTGRIDRFFAPNDGLDEA